MVFYIETKVDWKTFITIMDMNEISILKPSITRKKGRKFNYKLFEAIFREIECSIKEFSVT